MHGRYPFYPKPRASEHRSSSARARANRSTPTSALDRLRRTHRFRARAIRELGLDVPAAVLDRHPRDLAWRVSVMDRWIGRHLDLAGGRRLPPWSDAETLDDEEEDERERDDDGEGEDPAGAA